MLIRSLSSSDGAKSFIVRGKGSPDAFDVLVGAGRPINHAFVLLGAPVTT
jgi:hypothetical protein